MDCKVNVTGGTLPEEEIQAYIHRAEQKYGTKPQGIDIKVDGEYVELSVSIPIWNRLGKSSAIAKRRHALDKATAEANELKRAAMQYTDSSLADIQDILSEAIENLTVKTLFAEMPDEVIPYLTKTNRLDCIDFMESNMKAEVTNEFGGKSLMTALSNDSLSMRLNEACRIDMFLLTTTQPVDGQQQVVALLRSIMIDEKEMETDIEFYSVHWKKLTETPSLVSADEERIKDRTKTSNIINFIKERLKKD